MAKKVKITKGGQTVYPATVMDAVVHKDLRVDSSKLIEEVNVSKIFPTGGIDGTNKYTLETAIAKIPASLRNVGIKCSFLDEGGELETWEHLGLEFTSVNSWYRGGTKEIIKTGLHSEILENNIRSLNTVDKNVDNTILSLPAGDISLWIDRASFDNRSQEAKYIIKENFVIDTIYVPILRPIYSNKVFTEGVIVTLAVNGNPQKYVISYDDIDSSGLNSTDSSTPKLDFFYRLPINKIELKNGDTLYYSISCIGENDKLSLISTGDQTTQLYPFYVQLSNKDLTDNNLVNLDLPSNSWTIPIFLEFENREVKLINSLIDKKNETLLKSEGYVGINQIATKLSGLSTNIITEDVTGKYVLNGGINNYGGTAKNGYAGAHVIPGTTIEWMEYMEISFASASASNNYFAFYDSENNYIPLSIIEIDDKFWIETLEDLGSKRYRITVPQNAVYFRFNYLYTDEYYIKQTYKGDGTDRAYIPWLKIVSEEVEGLDEKIEEAIEEATTTLYNLQSSIQKPIDFNGKKVVAFGDSITAGISSPGLVPISGYMPQFCDMVGAELRNLAVSGQCITDSTDAQYSIYKRVTTLDYEGDIIWIAGGTNDWNQGMPLGDFDSVDTTTFYGALRGICDYLHTNHPDAIVIFVTPIPYTKPASSYPNHIADLDAYRSAIYEIATLYGYSVVSGSELGMPYTQGNWNNEMCDDSDGCHPTEKGHTLMARSLCGKLL